MFLIRGYHCAQNSPKISNLGNSNRWGHWVLHAVVCATLLLGNLDVVSADDRSESSANLPIVSSGVASLSPTLEDFGVGIDLVSNAALQVSPLGIPYVVAPDTITARGWCASNSSDSPKSFDGAACGGQLRSAVNASELKPGEEPPTLSTVGSHVASTVLYDKSGSIISYSSRLFQVRQRPYLPIQGKLTEFACNEGENGDLNISARIQMGSPSTPLSTNFERFSLMMVDEQGQFFGGVYPLVGTFETDQTNQANPVASSLGWGVTDECHPAVEYAAVIDGDSGVGCPAGIYLTGRAVREGGEEVDIGGYAFLSGETAQASSNGGFNIGKELCEIESSTPGGGDLTKISVECRCIDEKWKEEPIECEWREEISYANAFSYGSFDQPMESEYGDYYTGVLAAIGPWQDNSAKPTLSVITGAEMPRNIGYDSLFLQILTALVNEFVQSMGLGGLVNPQQILNDILSQLSTMLGVIAIRTHDFGSGAYAPPGTESNANSSSPHFTRRVFLEPAHGCMGCQCKIQSKMSNMLEGIGNSSYAQGRNEASTWGMMGATAVMKTTSAHYSGNSTVENSLEIKWGHPMVASMGLGFTPSLHTGANTSGARPAMLIRDVDVCSVEQYFSGSSHGAFHISNYETIPMIVRIAANGTVTVEPLGVGTSVGGQVMLGFVINVPVARDSNLKGKLATKNVKLETTLMAPVADCAMDDGPIPGPIEYTFPSF